jgi:hypothetical protein
MIEGEGDLDIPFSPSRSDPPSLRWSYLSVSESYCLMKVILGEFVTLLDEP